MRTLIILIMSLFLSHSSYSQSLGWDDIERRSKEKELMKINNIRKCNIYKTDTNFYISEYTIDNINFDEQKEYLYQTLTYDTSGFLTSKTIYNFDGTRKSYKTFTYVNDVYWLETKLYIDSTRQTTTTYGYDSAGNHVSTTFTGKDGQITESHETKLTYDSNMNIKQIIYDDKGGLYSSWTMEYDSLNNEIISESKGVKYSYMYNENGLKTSWTIDDKQGEDKVQVHNYDYNENGHLIKDIFFYKKSGDIIHIDINQYTNDNKSYSVRLNKGYFTTRADWTSYNDEGLILETIYFGKEFSREFEPIGHETRSNYVTEVSLSRREYFKY